MKKQKTITFKVWLEIERLNEKTGDSENMDAPGSQGQRALIGNLGNLGGLARWALFVYTFPGVAFMTVAPGR